MMFGPEDGGDTVLQTMDHLQTTQHYILEGGNIQGRGCSCIELS
jgi:hypothetical protein